MYVMGYYLTAMAAELGTRPSTQEITFQALPRREISSVPESKERLNTRSKVLYITPEFPARSYNGRFMGPIYGGSFLANTAKEGLHSISDFEVLDLDTVHLTRREKQQAVVGVKERHLRERKLQHALRIKRDEVVIKKLIEEDWAFVGLSYLSFHADEAMRIAKIADLVLENKGFRDREKPLEYTPIVTFNRGVTHPQDYAQYYPVDFWVPGGTRFDQPLDTTLEIAELIGRGDVADAVARKKITGIVTMDWENEGKVHNTTHEAEYRLPTHAIDFYFENLQRVGKHDSEVYDFDPIFRDKKTGKLLKTAQLYTQIGCGNVCYFCFESERPAEETLQKRYMSRGYPQAEAERMSSRSLASVQREIETLLAEGYEAFYFDDSTFTENKQRALEFIAMMKEFHDTHGIVWGMNTRIDTLDDDIIDALANDTGIVYQFSGVESLVPEVIEGIGKVQATANPDYAETMYPEGKTGQAYVDRTKEVYRKLRERGMTDSVFLIFGCPKRIPIEPGEPVEEEAQVIFEPFRDEDGRPLIKDFTGQEVGKLVGNKVILGRYYKILPATIDDDKRSIRETIWELQPDYLAFNVLRFIPDSKFATAPDYKKFRGGYDFRGGFYYRERRKAHFEEVKKVPKASHPIYMAFESAGDRYPQPAHMTPEVCYELLSYMVEEVNLCYRETARKVNIVTDREFARKYLKRGKDGMYRLAPFDQMSKDAQSPYKTWLDEYSRHFVGDERTDEDEVEREMQRTRAEDAWLVQVDESLRGKEGMLTYPGGVNLTGMYPELKDVEDLYSNACNCPFCAPDFPVEESDNIRVKIDRIPSQVLSNDTPQERKQLRVWITVDRDRPGAHMALAKILVERGLKGIAAVTPPDDYQYAEIWARDDISKLLTDLAQDPMFWIAQNILIDDGIHKDRLKSLKGLNRLIPGVEVRIQAYSLACSLENLETGRRSAEKRGLPSEPWREVAIQTTRRELGKALKRSNGQIASEEDALAILNELLDRLGIPSASKRK